MANASQTGRLKGNNDLLGLTRLTLIREIREQYLAAGADILKTNTSSAQHISLAGYRMGELTRKTNLAAARLAREAADEFSAPTSRASSPASSNRPRRPPTFRWM